MTQKLKVAIQGGPASFHEVAAQQYFPQYEVESVPCQSFRQLCEVLNEGKADQAVMAVENTLAGSILPNYNLLHQFNLFVTGELWLPIEQNLMALPGQQLQDLTKVVTHPMALNQCMEFLTQQPQLQLQESHDTADSAREIREKGLQGVAAIASKQAAALYRLEMLAENIEDRRDNFTRFLIVSREQPQESVSANKATLLLQVSHEGSLADVFRQLHLHDIHVALIQTLPATARSHAHYMVIELEGTSSNNLRETITSLEPLVEYHQLLGLYQKTKYPEHPNPEKKVKALQH
ncbi:prephenate dehydratase [Pontibacter brevis]